MALRSSALITIALALVGCGEEQGPKVDKEPVPVVSNQAPPTDVKTTVREEVLPLLALTAKEIRFGGKPVGSPLEAADVPIRIEKLFDAMKAERDAVKKRTGAFRGTYLLRSAGSVSMGAVKSAVQTAAYGGFDAPQIEVGKKRIPVSVASTRTTEAERAMKLLVVVGEEDVRLVTRKGREDVTSEKTALGEALTAAVKKRIAALEGLEMLVLYVPNAQTYAAFGEALEAIAKARGGDQPPIRLSIIETPRPSESELVTKGKLPATVIQRILRQNARPLRTCYEQGLKRNPELEGRVVVRFTINASGKVNQRGIVGSLPDPLVKRCLGQEIAKLNFPQPEAGVVEVEYPIVFTP